MGLRVAMLFVKVGLQGMGARFELVSFVQEFEQVLVT